MSHKSNLRTDWPRIDALTDADIAQSLVSDADAAPDVAGALTAGHFRRIDPTTPDITTIRARSGLTQRAFAKRYGLDLRALQDWEQGRRQPSKSLQSYLRVIDRNGEMVAEALAET